MLFLCVFSVKVFASAEDGACLECEISETKYLDGYVGNPIQKYITILGENYTFDFDDIYDVGSDVTDWFINLPEGLEAMIDSIIDEQSFSIEISGTPTEESNEAIELIMPSAFIYDAAGPLYDGDVDPLDLPDPDLAEIGFYTDITNDCVLFNIVNPYINCTSTTIKEKVGTEISQDITITLYGGINDHFSDSFENQTFNGLTISKVGFNPNHKELYLHIEGTMSQEGQTVIQAPVNTQSNVLTTANSCLILEVEEEPPVVPPHKPDKPKPFIVPSTGIE